MAGAMSKKPVHPLFPRMICDAMHAQPMPMSLKSLKAWLGSHYKLGNGWEKHVTKVVKVMLAKKQLVHAHGHMGSFRLSKAMAAKEEKRRARRPRVMKADKVAAAPMKKKAAAAPKKAKAGKKMEGPAKRAKKAAPKK